MGKVMWIEGQYRPIGNKNNGSSITEEQFNQNITSINQKIQKIEVKLNQIESPNFKVDNESLIL